MGPTFSLFTSFTSKDRQLYCLTINTMFFLSSVILFIFILNGYMPRFPRPDCPPLATFPVRGRTSPSSAQKAVRRRSKMCNRISPAHQESAECSFIKPRTWDSPFSFILKPCLLYSKKWSASVYAYSPETAGHSYYDLPCRS